MIRVPWISQVYSIELPFSFLREQQCNHKSLSCDTVILHVQTKVWSSPVFLITGLSAVADPGEAPLIFGLN